MPEIIAPENARKYGLQMIGHTGEWEWCMPPGSPLPYGFSSTDHALRIRRMVFKDLADEFIRVAELPVETQP
jgi:hypothetical protein